jgi:hypothetical protein
VGARVARSILSGAASFRCEVEGRDEAIPLTDEEIAHLHCNRAPFGAVHVSHNALAMTPDIGEGLTHAFSPRIEDFALARLSL